MPDIVRPSVNLNSDLMNVISPNVVSKPFYTWKDGTFFFFVIDQKPINTDHVKPKSFSIVWLSAEAALDVPDADLFGDDHPRRRRRHSPIIQTLVHVLLNQYLQFEHWRHWRCYSDQGYVGRVFCFAHLHIKHADTSQLI